MQALVIDDSRVMRTILTRLLTTMNFTVLQAEDGPRRCIFPRTACAIVRALAAGAHEYVIKPFTEDDIALNSSSSA